MRPLVELRDVDRTVQQGEGGVYVVKGDSAVGDEFRIKGGFSVFEGEVHDLGKITV